jgi:hypothetical protein
MVDRGLLVRPIVCDEQTPCLETVARGPSPQVPAVCLFFTRRISTGHVCTGSRICTAVADDESLSTTATTSTNIPERMDIVSRIYTAMELPLEDEEDGLLTSSARAYHITRSASKHPQASCRSHGKHLSATITTSAYRQQNSQTHPNSTLKTAPRRHSRTDRFPSAPTHPIPIQTALKHARHARRVHRR